MFGYYTVWFLCGLFVCFCAFMVVCKCVHMYVCHSMHMQLLAELQLTHVVCHIYLPLIGTATKRSVPSSTGVLSLVLV